MIAIVTGASSGIGYETCRKLLEKGYTVYGFSRRGTAPEGVNGMAVDVTDETAVRMAVDDVATQEGRIDLLINNAGMGISGPVEFTSLEDAQRIMNVNFMGQFICAKSVIKHMRAQKNGRIVFISSVAAPIAIPYQMFYSASKSAVNSMALALRNEVKDFGISICAVMPGDAHTGFTSARKKQEAYDDIYIHNSSATASMEKDELSGMSPADVADVIIKAAGAKHPKPLYVAGGKYKLFTALFKFLPARTSYWIVGKMYQ